MWHGLARAYDLLQESELERPFRGVECGYVQLRSVGIDTLALVTGERKRLPHDQGGELEYRQALGAVA